jgi:translation initiation factor 2 beta subunit (eIF-2beta)/eIF-5
MKLTYTTKNGRITAELEGESQKDLFGELNKFQEVFEENICGKCGNEDVKFVVRTVDDNQYYELRCSKCGARLAFGVHKKGGGLFPKRKDNDGKWLPDNGWVKWNPKTEQSE